MSSLWLSTAAAAAAACLVTIIHITEGLRVEINEIVNHPDIVAKGMGSSNGCRDVLTRDDGDFLAGSRRNTYSSTTTSCYYSCTHPRQRQQLQPTWEHFLLKTGEEGEEDADFYHSSDRSACSLTYQLYRELGEGRETISLDSVFVAFAKNSRTALRVFLDGVVVVESWEGEEGSTALQMVPGLEGYVAEELTLEAIMEGDEWMGITETEIYVNVEDVPLAGVSASDLVHVIAKATVKQNDARTTLDGNTSKMRAWACSEGDVCEITYDLRDLHFIEQVRIAFVGKSSARGAKFNVYTAGDDQIFSSVLAGIPAGMRGSSVKEDLQTYGGIRTWGRYVKVEGVVGEGGNFFISEVEIRVGTDRNPTSQRVGKTIMRRG